ncbi:MAG TPA: hypothetical protein VHK90_01505, partial [Thermoanaerobaculia bacterium]|nr:hypothetical protein [Thermoanaerobaculia bacterium]
PSTGDRFSVEKAVAREALDGLAPRPSGVTAAVALVSIEAAAIDVFFVHHSRTDRRTVDRILPFRASRNDATFSD